MHADQVEYFDRLGKVVAQGNVEAVYQDVKLTCDRATIYMDTKDAYLEGHAVLVQMGGLLKGEEILYNFKTRKGTVLQAQGEFGPWRSSGDRVQKLAATAFLHQDGYLTTCDFEQPHTRLRAKQMRVFLDDKVVLKHVVAYLGGVPVLYLPSYTHPLDDKRPRVTLIPGKHKEWGLFLLSSWRVYLHENLQGRFHVDYRERLDLATGLDLHYKLPVGGEGLFREYYTHERALHREHAWSKYTSSDPGQPTTERERYRVQVRHVWDMDKDSRATLEYNQVSDPTVVKDFFYREFQEGTANAETYFQIIRTQPWYGLTFLTTWRANRFETATQRLPFLELNVRPVQIPWLPTLERWGGPLAQQPEMDAELDPELREKFSLGGWHYQASFSFERSNVDSVKNGTEAALTTYKTTQELFYPTRLLGWLNARPFVRFQHAGFSRGLTELAPQFRQAMATGLDLTSKFFRIFPIQTHWMGMDLHLLRHVITPSVSYTYQAKPTLSADRLLRSDGLAKGNTLTLGKEHKLQTKRKVGDRWQSVDLARFSTSLPYDLEGSAGRGGRWGDVGLDLELLPYPWLRVESDAQIDTHIGKFSTINADLVAHPNLTDSRGGTSVATILDESGGVTELPWAVGVGWRYQPNTSAQMTLETEFDLGRKWRVGIFQALDVKRFITETTTAGQRTVKKIYDVPEYEYRLRRDLHEWTVELIYNVRRQRGEGVFLLFRLKALPELPLQFERNYHQPKAGRNFPKR